MTKSLRILCLSLVAVVSSLNSVQAVNGENPLDENIIVTGFTQVYPFKITTNPSAPELYAIKSGRGDAYWWTLDESDGSLVLKAYESAPTQHWYFMEVTEGETTYLQLYPYAGEGKAMGYKDTAAGAAKVWAVAPGTEGYDCRWIFDNNFGNAPYGLKTSNNTIYLSNYGGVNYKMGFWTTGPSGDGGAAMYFSYVKFEPVHEKAHEVTNSDMYQLHQKYGLIQDTKKFYCNVPQTNDGSLDNLLDNKYDTYFHSAWQASLAKPEKHYLQAEVSVPVKEFSFYFKKRHNNNNNRPVDMTVQGSVDGVTYKDLANINSGFPTSELELAYLSEVITAPEACKYFRFVVNETNNNALTSGYPFFTYSEFYIFPNNEEVAEKVGLHKAARNVLAVSETEDDASTMYDVYLALADILEKGAGAFAKDLVSAYNALAADFFAGKDLSNALAEYNTLVTLSTSNDLLTPVKDAASLAANKRYVLAAAESAVVMGDQYKEEGLVPYRHSVEVSKIRDFIESKVAVAEGEELPYMIELVAADGGWLLKDVVYGQYLVWEEERSLDLTSDAKKASVFEISINAEGEAVIKLAGTDCTIRFGEDDDRFACYTSGHEAVKLYEDAVANDFFLAYPELANVFNTNQSMWMIPAVSEKAMTVIEAANAINAAGVVACAPEDLKNAVAAIEEFIAYASAMDAKYNEFKEQLYVCFDLQDNSTASVKVATAFAAVVDKYSAYQWSVPATTVAEFDTYIAELNEAARNYAIKAAPADGFTFDNIAVESEWNGAELGKSLAGHLYNPAADAFLGTANSWGTQASFLENGFKWTVSSEAICDFEWLFDGAEDICAANVGGIALVPCHVGANNTVPIAFADGEDNGIIQTADGIVLPKTTCLFMDLDEAADLTDYTFVYDLKVADSNPYISMYQTDLNNNNDGDLFIAKGTFGINSGGLGYGGQVVSNQWHRLAFVVKAGVISTYIDGAHIGTASNANNNNWVINKEGVFLFLDNDGEHNDVELAGIKMWKKALTETEVAQLNEAASAPTYTVSGPLAHPQDPAVYRYLAYRPGNNAGYADQPAQEHTFTRVGKNIYTIQSYEGKYLAYQEGNAVVQYVNQMDENCYWQFVTEEEFRSKFAEATAVNPVNATFAIEGQGFGYNNTGVKMWTGEPNTGGDYADYVAYKQNVENFDFSYVVRNMPSGVYRLKVQGFYRQGTPEAAVEARKNGTEINPAKFYANDASVTVMSIIEEAGKNTASTHGGMYGDYGKCPLSNNDASIYFNVGLYEHELVFTLEEGIDTIKIGMAKNGGVADDWAVMDNFRLEYLGAKNDADFMGAGVVDAMTEGDKYVYYTSADGKKHYLYAAGEHNWVVVDEPTTIAFSTGKGTYAKSASHMTSNGFQMANTVNGDGTGAIATSTNTRDWESQVFYKNAAGKYAIRLTNVNATNWGAFKFVNINAETLEISAGLPELGDELYLWEVEDAIILNTITYEVNGEVYHTDSLPYGASITAPVSPSKDGYTFSGWIELPKTMPGNDITVIGVFIANNYQITYMIGDEVYYTDSVTYGAQIPTVTPSKEGYTFNVWEGLPETMPAYDLVVEGSFSINSYTITYILDGRVYKTVTYNYGETIVPEESPKTTGYVFSGWLGLPETMPAEDLIIVGVLAALDGNYTDDQGVQYTLEDNKEGYAVSGISKNPASNIVIPAKVNDLPVTAIYERAFIAVENVQSVVIPSNITTVGKNVFYGCKNLLFIEWNTTVPLRADCFDKVENHGNMLVFVNDADTEVSYKGNVIVEGAAEQITISDDMAFRSPQQFTARNISFTRNFDKKTKIGVSGGWEAMVLPFDVQSVVSKNRGELKPFGEADFTTSLPYWLGELQADGTFATTQSITANKPFIMQLPNSDEYLDIYNVEGEVTFSATNVTVHPTTDVEQEASNGYVMLGSYEGTTADSHVYALNDEEYIADKETYMPGSIFVANSRDIRPFEAYVYTTNAGRAPYLRVGNAGETGIGHSTFNVQHSTEIYDLTGRKVLNTENLKGGIYIVNGKRVIFK